MLSNQLTCSSVQFVTLDRRYIHVHVFGQVFSGSSCRLYYTVFPKFFWQCVLMVETCLCSEALFICVNCLLVFLLRVFSTAYGPRLHGFNLTVSLCCCFWRKLQLSDLSTMCMYLNICTTVHVYIPLVKNGTVIEFHCCINANTL